MSTEPGRPYLAVVAASRNDDHGGDPLRRLQLSLDTLAVQCDRFGLDAEYILVDWNPPPDRPGLAEVVRWPSSPRLQCRVITVPAEVHSRYEYADRLPFFQMIAKNVGIRRARAPFVLATNIDILFADAMVEMLARRTLAAGCMYRVDRHDVEQPIPGGLGVPGLLAYCAGHVFRRHQRLFSYVRRGNRWVLAGIGTQWLGYLGTWCQYKGYLPTRLKFWPHTNGCGDFTLLHRDDWMSLGGYPEWAMYSFHLDSLLCHAAVISGIREVVLPPECCAYHVEHAIGSGWTPEGAKLLNRRLDEVRIRRLGEREVLHRIRAMQAGRESTSFNGRDEWGIPGVDFKERTFEAGASRTTSEEGNRR